MKFWCILCGSHIGFACDPWDKLILEQIMVLLFIDAYVLNLVTVGFTSTYSIGDCVIRPFALMYIRIVWF